LSLANMSACHNFKKIFKIKFAYVMNHTAQTCITNHIYHSVSHHVKE
jgi:hypothetical protein